MELELKTKQLVDELKKTCADNGLGNSGFEYIIITEVFLYKFMNDKFFYEIRKRDKKYRDVENLEAVLKAMPDSEYERLLFGLPPTVTKLKKEQWLSFFFNAQNQEEFAKLFDDTLKAIASDNADIFSVGTSGGE
jgi:type I restriction enzyme M protein